MNIHAPLDPKRYDGRLWWVIVAGCAARFTVERDPAAAVAGFAFWFAVFVGSWIVRSVASGRPDSPQRLHKAGNLIAIAGMLLFLLRFNSDGLVPSLLTFLFAIQAAVFVTAAKRLHAWLILGAAFAGVLFAAAESRSPIFLIAATWFTFAGLGVLALEQRVERERAMLLVPRENLGRATGGFAFACIALLLSIPVYLFVPKPAGLLLGGMQAHTAHDYRPDSDGNRRSDPRDASSEPRAPSDVDAPAEDVEADAPPARPEHGDYGAQFSTDQVRRDLSSANNIVLYVKSSRPVYLRGTAYDRFENDRWHRDAPSFAELQLQRGNAEVATAYGDAQIKQSVEVAVDLGNTLWHAPGLQKLRFPGPSIRRYEDDVFTVPQNLRAATIYSVESRPMLQGGRYLLLEAEPTNLERYLRADAASAEIRELVRSLTHNLQSAQAKALALERHLRASYEYSYETIPQQGYTPLDTFLFETRRGHCEYFASALAMMLRVANIPSRVVTGFSLGEPNPITGYYEVRGLDGHAWVEAHIEGAWVMLEPTPFYPLPQESSGSQVAEQMDRYLERLVQQQELLTPDSITAELTRTVRDAWRATRKSLRSVVLETRQLGWMLAVWIALAVAGVATVYLAVLAIVDALDNRDVRRTLAQARSVATADATLLATTALQAAGLQRGFAREPAASFREYVESLNEQALAVPLELAEAFDEVRYGPGVSARDNASLIGRTVAVINAQLREDPLPRLRRAIANGRRGLAEMFGRS